MSDFMKWLYAHYIKPQIDAVPMEEYAFYLDLVRNNLTPSSRKDLEKAMEFQAVQAFLLGLRTGQGLSGSFRPSAADS